MAPSEEKPNTVRVYDVFQKASENILTNDFFQVSSSRQKNRVGMRFV